MIETDITVVIPTIPPRMFMLQRALTSVQAQTLQPSAINIAVDIERIGAPGTRQKALMSARTSWVAFLDDDDEFMPHHLERLMTLAQATDADYTYSWFETKPHGCDPFPTTHFTLPWDNAQPRQTTVVTLVKTELAQSVGFIHEDEHGIIDGQRGGEDWQFTLGCLAAGAKIEHLVERTWYWHHHGRNTSGMATRW